MGVNPSQFQEGECGRLTFVRPDWPAPSSVHGVTTTRLGGMSERPYDSFNLADHVGDEPDRVMANRRQLARCLNLPSAPAWLRQVHSARAVNMGQCADPTPEADAAYTTDPGIVCAVMTADCLPVLLTDIQGTRVAAAHAGWRGLAAGVLESTVQSLGVPGANLMAWLGPAIGPDRFEVGAEVRQVFVEADDAAQQAFRPSAEGRWMADIYALARLRLQKVGVGQVYGGGWCTYDDERFYSFRRDRTTGRMASLVWIEPAS